VLIVVENISIRAMMKNLSQKLDLQSNNAKPYRPPGHFRQFDG
jgi:hypothetical protein